MDNDSLHYYEFYTDLLEESHCVMVDVPRYKKLMEYIEKIPSNLLYKPSDAEYGRTKEPHITVLYGIAPLSEQTAKNILSKIPKKLVAELGKVSKFENPNSPFDVIFVEVKSPHLTAIHKTLTKTCENANQHPEYHPHVTLAYVEKGSCNEYVGDTTFQGTKVLFETFLYSNGNREENHQVPMKEYAVGSGGGYGGATGGSVAPSGWAGTPTVPQTARRLHNYSGTSNSRSYMQGNTIIGTTPYDTIMTDDLLHAKFSSQEIFAGLRYEMKRMEFPDKDRAKPIVLKNLTKNPKYYSDLNMYFQSDK
jgi:2'-5' RNA ligase